MDQAIKQDIVEAFYGPPPCEVTIRNGAVYSNLGWGDTIALLMDAVDRLRGNRPAVVPEQRGKVPLL